MGLETAVVKQVEGLLVEAEGGSGYKINYDEPEEFGGSNKAQSPTEGLLSALGACKLIVLLSYAEDKEIKLNNAEVKVEGELDPNGFTLKDPEAKMGFSQINVTYEIDADNAKEEIEEFVQFVEETCPVGDTIINSPEINVKIV